MAAVGAEDRSGEGEEITPAVGRIALSEGPAAAAFRRFRGQAFDAKASSIRFRWLSACQVSGHNSAIGLPAGKR